MQGIITNIQLHLVHHLDWMKQLAQRTASEAQLIALIAAAVDCLCSPVCSLLALYKFNPAINNIH